MAKNKTVIIFAAAIVIAFIAAALSYKKLQNKPVRLVKESGSQKAETVSVIVALTDLAWGTSLNKTLVKEVPFLKESMSSGYFSDLSAIEGRTLIYPVNANEPIFESRLAPDSFKTGGIAAIIGENKRAMAIKVAKIMGNTGFVRPGNRVDVLVSLSGKGGVSGPITKTVLENILVLAAGHNMRNNKEGHAKMNVVTLEVDHVEAEKLALATTQGAIQLTLRNYADTKEVVTTGATIPALLASYRRLQAEKPDAEQPSESEPIPSVSVEVIKGSSISKYYF